LALLKIALHRASWAVGVSELVESPIRVLILGASYGSLFATKLAAAGHHATLVCLPAECDLINLEGTLIRLPVKDSAQPIELRSNIRASSAEEAIPGDYDLTVLAMQEPQYSAPAVRALLEKIGLARVPCMSIMNMPPLPFLARLPAVDTSIVAPAYASFDSWSSIDPALITLASPDPQAFRPPDEPVNVLQVGLPTNFKVAPFESETHTEMLRQLQLDIEATRYDLNGQSIALPVKLKLHDSVYVPLAKWLMLVAGNYRCVQANEMQSIKDAVHGDIEASRDVYQWVGKLCTSLGADENDLVPFEKYANAAKNLLKPSSAARALLAGAKNIERVDKLVQQLALARGLRHAEMDAIVERVDLWLEKNRQAETA